MPPSTSGRIVDFASGLIRSTRASPASMSTPASRWRRTYATARATGPQRDERTRDDVAAAERAPGEWYRAKHMTARVPRSRRGGDEPRGWPRLPRTAPGRARRPHRPFTCGSVCAVFGPSSAPTLPAPSRSRSARSARDAPARRRERRAGGIARRADPRVSDRLTARCRQRRGACAAPRRRAAPPAQLAADHGRRPGWSRSTGPPLSARSWRSAGRCGARAAAADAGCATAGAHGRGGAPGTCEPAAARRGLPISLTGVGALGATATVPHRTGEAARSRRRRDLGRRRCCSGARERPPPAAGVWQWTPHSDACNAILERAA